MHAPLTFCCHETRNASYERQKRNNGVTEIGKMAGRGHSLTIDAGWREVAEKALEFVNRLHERFLVRPASDHGGRG